VSRRCTASGQHVIGVALHLGAAMDTGLARDLGLRSTLRMLRELLVRRRLLALLAHRPKTSAEGAATTVLCALDPRVAGGGHFYYVDCVPEARRVHPLAADEALARELWAYTERAVADDARLRGGV
jgi:hypothetical protein